MRLQDIHAGKLYLVRCGRSIRIVECKGQISGQLAWYGKDDLGIDRRFGIEGVVGEFTKPTITTFGMKPGNKWHLVNRTAKALKDTGVDLSDLKTRCLNQTASLSFEECMIACLEYVEVTHENI